MTATTDRIAVITGASSGIGRAVARALAADGWVVVLTARNVAALETLAREIGAGGGRALVLPGDMTSAEDPERVIDESIARLGRIDLLIVSAGVYVRKRPWETAVDDYRASMELNFYGAVRSILRVLPHMLERRSGHIVGLSSVDGKKGLTYDVLYVPSKFALTGFLDVLRQELHGTGVAVTTVLPGRVDTPMIEQLKVPVVSAKISADAVAHAVMRGLRRRSPEILVPYWSSKAIVVLAALWPRLGDWLVRIFRLEGRTTAP